MKLQTQYDKLAQAYKDMGLDLPISFEVVESKLTAIQKRAISRGEGQLVIVPTITEKFTFQDLINAFDKKQSIKTWVWENLWYQYDLNSPATLNVISLKSDNQWDDPVVQHVNKTVTQQTKVKGELLSPTEAIILAAILRLDNNQLAPNTFIRFPQLGFKPVGGGSYVGNVNSLGGLLGFGGSDGSADPNDGVGLSVGQRLELGSSSLSSVSTLPDELTIEGKLYRVVR